MIIRTALAALLVVAAPHMVSSAHADDDCPEAFKGAAVTLNRVYDGVSLTFTTDADKMDLLRAQLRELAMMLEQKGTEVQTASYDEDVEFPPVDLDVVDIQGGATVRVRASRPRDIPELRELARSFERYWSTSACHGDLHAMEDETPAPKARPVKKSTTRQTRRTTRPVRQARR